ncbi:MAG TPA: hypothetical protein VHM25_18425, partial [Polyangiaceae bacterium]|nr:hypothetical protein [Polyangiaceae bacterium]
VARQTTLTVLEEGVGQAIVGALVSRPRRSAVAIAAKVPQRVVGVPGFRRYERSGPAVFVAFATVRCRPSALGVGRHR